MLAESFRESFGRVYHPAVILIGVPSVMKLDDKNLKAELIIEN